MTCAFWLDASEAAAAEATALISSQQVATATPLAPIPTISALRSMRQIQTVIDMMAPITPLAPIPTIKAPPRRNRPTAATTPPLVISATQPTAHCSVPHTHTHTHTRARASTAHACADIRPAGDG